MMKVYQATALTSIAIAANQTFIRHLLLARIGDTGWGDSRIFDAPA